MRRTLLLVSLLLLPACDKGEAPAATVVDAGPPPAPARVQQTTAEALRAEGTIDAKKGGPQLQWRQGVNGGAIEELVACGDRLYALSSGRIVEWDGRTHAPKRVLDGFGAVTAIHANDRTLLAGTSDGRILRSNCDGHDPKAARERGLPIHLVRLDPRSKTRAFVAYEEAPTKANKLNGTHATVGLVDVESGKFVRDPFQTPLPEKAHISGFVDYRGQLWFALTPQERRSKIWYLERFEPGLPPVAGLGDGNRVRGFYQNSREVWAYGGPVKDPGSFIFRVDTNRARPMWDGKEGWFGEQPGGDLPTMPITFIEKRKKELIIGTTSAVYAVDPELRRWRALEGNDPEPGVMSTATEAVTAGSAILLGTQHGLIEVKEEGWERFTVPPTGATENGKELVSELTWAERNWVATPKGLQVGPADSERLSKHKGGPRKNVYGLFVDQGSRLWAFADDGMWMIENGEKLTNTKWDPTSAGFAPGLVTTVADGPEGSLVVTTTQDLMFRMKVAPAPAEK